MSAKTISLKELSLQNVKDLSEENVFDILFQLIKDYPKAERAYYTDILTKVFDFRSIHATNNNLKKEMSRSGYKFFNIPYNNKLIMAIRNKGI